MVKICCLGGGYIGGPTMAVIALKCPGIYSVVVFVSKPLIEGLEQRHPPNLQAWQAYLWQEVQETSLEEDS